MTTEGIKVPKALLVSGVNGYSDSAQQLKTAFHAQGKKFLKDLAKTLGMATGTYDIRSNLGGVAGSGEVTLHGEKLYVQLLESVVGEPGISMLYRGCDGRKDYTGKTYNFLAMHRFNDPEHQASALRTMTQLIAD